MSDAKEILKQLALKKVERDKIMIVKKEQLRKLREQNAKKTLEDKPEPKKRGRPRKDANIMKARTDIKDNVLTTEMNVKGGLSDKVKKALKESIMGAIESKITGRGGGTSNSYKKYDNGEYNDDEESMRPREGVETTLEERNVMRQQQIQLLRDIESYLPPMNVQFRKGRSILELANEFTNNDSFDISNRTEESKGHYENTERRRIVKINIVRELLNQYHYLSRQMSGGSITEKKRGRPRKIKGRGLEDEIQESKESKGIGSIELQRKNQQIGNVKSDTISGYYAKLMQNTSMSGLRDNM